MGQLALKNRAIIRAHHRGALLRACALAALATNPAVALATAPLGGFEGHLIGSTGGVTRVATGPTTETLTIASHTATLDWLPFDQATGGGAIDFLPAGNVVTFTSVPGITDYTVLNRIVPTDATRPIAFNGQVVSTLEGTDAIGGNIWFYSPGGIVVGATAVFDVGSLLLTTSDVSHFTWDPSGFSATFTSPASSAAKIQIMDGAQINALQPGSYVAMIAPRIEQGGKVRVDGSAAYVAGEQVTMTMNQGLFDIQVDVGTTDPNGIVHTGETSGPANTAATDNHTIYMVAVPKNHAITMLLGGSIGFDAGSASVQNGAIFLSSADGITFTGGNISSSLTASADGSVFVNGNVRFDGAGSGDTVTIKAGKNIEVNTDTGSLAMLDSANQPSGTLDLEAPNIWIAQQSILTQLEADPNYSGRDAALAVNSGTSNLAGFVTAGAVNMSIANTLFGQNSGAADDMAGITAGAGGFSIASTGSSPALVDVYGRELNGGTTVTNADFAKQTVVSGSFTADSTVNGCPIGVGCAPPPPPPPPPPPAPQIPRDEIVLKPPPAAPITEALVIDFSQLLGDDLEIETGVTSGSDPSSWDPIDVDSDSNSDKKPAQ